MRIAHVVAVFPPYLAGTGKVAYHNCRELAQRGHQVDVYTVALPNVSAHEVCEGIQVHRLRPLARMGNAAFLPQLRDLARGYDILHLHYPFVGGEATALVSPSEADHPLRRAPLIITYHQDVILPGWKGWVEQALRQTTGRWLLRSAWRVLFTSLDYSRASVGRALLHGREEHIGELPNGVEADFFRPGLPPQSVAGGESNQARRQTALLVAGLDQAHYFKGVAIFLQALARLPADVHGLIVGDGDLRPSYEELSRLLGIAGRVTFAGRVAEAELPAYYNLADLTVLPSVTMGEAFGLVLVESLACGTPVIASNLPGVRTVVDDGADGFLVEAGSVEGLAAKMADLLEMTGERRKAMGAAGRQKVLERYTWDKIGDRLEAIYQEALESAP